MEVDKVGNFAAASYYAPLQKLADQANPTVNAQQSAPDTGSQNTVQPSDNVSLATSSVTRRNLDMVKAIEQEHAKLNLLVKSVKMTNEELDRTAGQVSQMGANLSVIIKNNPPFPPDSEKRKELLMSYASIRQEIIKLSVPAPPQPVYEKVKGMWSSLFGPTGQIVHDAVPNLHAASSDSEVRTAAKGLDSTGEKLANISSGITQALIKP